MSFETYENSVESGRPIELFHFSIGTEDFYYTSAEDTITYGGNVYVYRPLERNTVKQTARNNKGKLDVTLPTDDLVCSRFIGIVQPEPMELTITRFHRQDLLDGRVVWSGRMVQAVYKNDGRICQMTYIPSESVYSRQIPHYKYQGLCNHVIYDAGCKLVAATYQHTGTASGATGNLVTVAGIGAAKGNGWATGGKCTVNGEDRSVLDHTGDVLTLTLPFRLDPDGQTIDVFAGCDHSISTCNSKFSNSLNYGGFPFVPTKNPFRVGVR